jgi:hypothetical protein
VLGIGGLEVCIFLPYRLRDKLRMQAIEGKIDSESWAFDYVDSSICTTISKSEILNLFTVTMLYARHHRDAKVLNFNKKLLAELNKSENLKQIYAEYGAVIVQFIFKKHYISKFVAIILGSIVFGVQRLTKEMIKEVRVYPETSISYHFAG